MAAVAMCPTPAGGARWPRPEPMMASPSAAAPDSLRVQEVQDPARIAYLLMRLMETRAPLTISVPGQGEAGTLMVEMQLNSGMLFLDDPVPGLSLQPGALVSVRGRADGSISEFRCRLEQLVRLRGALAWGARLPVSLVHRERRSSFRVLIPHDVSLPPATFAGFGGAFRGRLLDVSENGAGTLVSDRSGAGIGSVFGCTLSLPGTRLVADVEVRSVAAALGSQRLGVLFSGLSNAQRAAIAHAVAALDRAVLRRYASARWL